MVNTTMHQLAEEKFQQQHSAKYQVSEVVHKYFYFYVLKSNFFYNFYFKIIFILYFQIILIY